MPRVLCLSPKFFSNQSSKQISANFLKDLIKSARGSLHCPEIRLQWASVGNTDHHNQGKTMGEVKIQYKNLVEMLEDSVQKYADRPLYGTKRGREYAWTSYREFGQLV